MEAISTWLCPTEFDRARVLDNSTRVRRARRVAAAAIGVALIALLPWFGIWILALFAASAVNLLTLDRRMARSKHPELVVASSLLFTELLLAGGVVLSGAGQSPALPWMVVPVGLTAARFRRRVMVTGAAIGLALMALATVAVDVNSVSPPTFVIAAVALMVSVVGIADALQSAELNYRTESVLDPLTGRPEPQGADVALRGAPRAGPSHGRLDLPDRRRPRQLQADQRPPRARPGRRRPPGRRL